MYEFEEDMGQISGFGGRYEDACRKMLKAGLEWLDKYPNTEPKYHGYKNIYGIISDDNEDARELDKVMLSACDDCTGAMH